MAVHGRYTIVGKLADGGMAEIFLGTQHGAEGFEKPVVLKRIHTAFSADPQFRNMFIDEAHISMSLNHGNVVQVLDLGVSGGRYFLVLELVDGWDLHQVLKRARAAQVAWPPALALYVAAGLCRALSFAHGKTQKGHPLGIVHRDVSPNNVLLSEQGEVKLADFGIAKAQRKREQTAAGVIKGKVAFMSPEQANGAVIDRRSDLFSVGSVLYLMTTDKQPFEGTNDLETLSRVQRAEFVPPDKVKPSLSPVLVRVMNRAMRSVPAERYQTADEMLADIERALRGEYQSAGQTELKQWLAQLQRRDGAPTISKRLGMPPLASGSGNGGTDLNAGTSFELGDLDLAAAMTEVAPPTPPPLPTPARAAATPPREATPPLTPTTVDAENAAARPANAKKDRPRHFRGFWLGAIMALGAVIGLRYFAEWAAQKGWVQETPMNRPSATAPEPAAPEPAARDKTASAPAKVPAAPAPASPAASPAAPATPAAAAATAPATTAATTPAPAASAAAADAGRAAPGPAVKPAAQVPAAAEPAVVASAPAADGGMAAGHPPEDDSDDDDTDEETLLRKADPNAATTVIGEEEAAPPPPPRKTVAAKKPAPPPPAKPPGATPAKPEVTKATAGTSGEKRPAASPAKPSPPPSSPPALPASAARLPGSGKPSTMGAAPPPPAQPKPAAAPYITISLHITSEPVGAVVRIKRRVLGRTPINLRFKTDNTYELTFVKDGYTPAKKQVTVRGTHDGKLAVSLKKKPAATGLRSLFHPHR